MPDNKKFEEMLERLISEDQKGAEKIFHDIVVEKSRKIYEDLLESDADYADDNETEDDDEEVEEDSKELDLEEYEDDEEDSVNDETDDFMNDVAGEVGDEDTGVEYGDDDYGEKSNNDDEDVEDRVQDLEDALDDLKKEFEKMDSEEDDSEDMDSEEDDSEDMDSEEDDSEDMDSEEDDSEDMDDEDYNKETESLDELETMREYVEKVTAKMGDEGQYNKSTVAEPNDMGGTVDNIAQNQDAETEGTKGGLEEPNLDSYGKDNVNVPGGKANKSNKKKKDVYSGNDSDKASNKDSLHGSRKGQGGRKS